MSESIKEEEPKQYYLDQPQEMQAPKSEMTPISVFGEQLPSERLERKVSLSQMKESGTRVRSRLYGSRGIF